MKNSLLRLGLLFHLFLIGYCRRSISETNNGAKNVSSLRLVNDGRNVVMDNGLLQVTLSNPGGHIIAVKYNGVDNILEYHNKDIDRGSWDVVWKFEPRKKEVNFERTQGEKFKVIVENEEQLEISFTLNWTEAIGDKLAPLNIDKRFVMLRGQSGFYSYAIYEHLKEFPAFVLDETRLAFKLSGDLFTYMAISDQTQRFMPTAKDRLTGQPLAYKEAVKLTNPSNPEFKGEVDDKYQYSCENQENRVHGWISLDPPIGFWVINPSDEYLLGGPVKQDLTSHVGPTSLSVFVSKHYAGEELAVQLSKGEHWKKVYGPVFIHLNTASDADTATQQLWKDAKQQMLKEVQNWPYSFPASDDFPSLDKRGNVNGQLFIQDRFLQPQNKPAVSANIGLALVGNAGSWQTENKGYQFWTKSNDDGSFSISGVRPGLYNLYGWVPGYVGDYKYNVTITITPGLKLNLGKLIYEPPRHGPTLWEIGIHDRSAKEFFVPDPNPEYINKLFVAKSSSSVDKFRQYGLWERYAELYPRQDLVYTVGTSDYRKDWFFIHVARSIGDNVYQPTTWQIVFKLNNVSGNPYMLRVAIASAAHAVLEVRINNPNVAPHFKTGEIGEDNAIARHGIHGLYHLLNVEIKSSLLVAGKNIIYLTQASKRSPLQGVMYDYIRLEAPSTSPQQGTSAPSASPQQSTSAPSASPQKSTSPPAISPQRRSASSQKRTSASTQQRIHLRHFLFLFLSLGFLVL